MVAAGDTCLDIGAGAGNDSLIASDRVGLSGRVVALDLTPAMARKLRQCASETGVDNVWAVQGSAESLPLGDGSVDCITSNGALNLIPDKRRAVGEMFRVLCPDSPLLYCLFIARRAPDARPESRHRHCMPGFGVGRDGGRASEVSDMTDRI